MQQEPTLCTCCYSSAKADADTNIDTNVALGEVVIVTSRRYA